MTDAVLPRLLVLTDRTQIGDRSLVDVVASALAGGARGIVLREKDLPRDERVALADEIRPLVRDAGGTFIVASDPTIEADGVHLAVADPLPDGASVGLVGRSVHTPDELAVAEAEGCDYVLAARVYPSLSKPGYGDVLGPTGLQQLCALAQTRVLALGGINWLNIGSFLPDHPPYGVALMGEVMRSPDPARAVGRVLERHPELAS